MPNARMCYQQIARDRETHQPGTTVSYHQPVDRSMEYLLPGSTGIAQQAWMPLMPNAFDTLHEPQTPMPSYTSMAQVRPALINRQPSPQMPLAVQSLPTSLDQWPVWHELMSFDPFFNPFALNTPSISLPDPEPASYPPLHSWDYLSPETSAQPSRNASTASNVSKTHSMKSYASSITSTPRSLSPDPCDSTRCGFVETSGLWRCGWPGCTSPSRFERICDLRKHYKRHYKVLCCRYPGCPKAGKAGFSNKKDRARHEAKHNPEIVSGSHAEGAPTTGVVLTDKGTAIQDECLPFEKHSGGIQHTRRGSLHR
ncbi:hypothetical protein B0A48_12675 [Cryoendolithus antarcticus]|uniref:C2H2-type domain-containing protein n=1 Tax=Cryoendolithus antarcticus TaxID=1507870 RepID=A0A1V8SRE8_9PEZI|nr:hypothetical protein B0A48_12675 [Cryoendolithus antarcticus]